MMASFDIGLPDRIQTYDLRFRRALLYSAELLEDRKVSLFSTCSGCNLEGYIRKVTMTNWGT